MPKRKNTKNAIFPSPLGQNRPCPIITDPQGCYTGKPIENMETPIQDADNL